MTATSSAITADQRLKSCRCQSHLTQLSSCAKLDDKPCSASERDTVTQFTDAPIFDADQHMYETPDALLKYLPEKYKSKVQFVQVGRHTRIAILGKITDYMPNPTFDRVAAPGAHEKFYSGQNPEGLTMREMSGRGIDTPPGARGPEDRIAELNGQNVAACLNYPTLANLVEH